MSSFRQATPAYSVVKDFRGHKDGVWEVNVSKLDSNIIGTASAGNICAPGMEAHETLNTCSDFYNFEVVYLIANEIMYKGASEVFLHWQKLESRHMTLKSVGVT